mmetsp:Transcript_48543/g.139405  ORF Transcript_48543/g.139405 Transcript_48543/m.139405 type:complete len:200 (-) Transcript_48543:282-881(-)
MPSLSGTPAATANPGRNDRQPRPQARALALWLAMVRAMPLPSLRLPPRPRGRKQRKLLPLRQPSPLTSSSCRVAHLLDRADFCSANRRFGRRCCRSRSRSEASRPDSASAKTGTTLLEGLTSRTQGAMPHWGMTTRGCWRPPVWCRRLGRTRRRWPLHCGGPLLGASLLGSDGSSPAPSRPPRRARARSARLQARAPRR